MTTEQRLGGGAALATLGALGTILAPALGWTEISGPAGFGLRFLFGIAAGVGVALCMSGLLRRRRDRARP